MWRTRLIFVSTLALTLCAASCSRNANDAPPKPEFPVRLFPQQSRRTILIDEALTDPKVLDKWHVLRDGPDGPELEPYSRYFAAPADDAAVKSPRAAVAILRTFDVPAKVEMECLARFTFDDGHLPRPSGPTPYFYAVPWEPGANPTNGAEASPRDTAKRLHDALQLRNGSTGAVWSDTLDATGAAIAFRPLPLADERRSYAAVFPLTTPPYQLAGLQVRQAAQWGRTTNTSRLSAAGSAAPSLSERIQPIRLAGDVRRCVFVPPGEEITFEAEGRAEADRIEFAIATEPVQGREVRTSIALDLAGDAAEFRQVAMPTLAHTGKSDPYFETVSFPMPAELAGCKVLRIRARVIGECGMLVGEPMLRSAQPTGRKNLLFVSIDTLRKDHLGCYGYRRPTSPFLDRVARGGARFQSVTAVAPYTLPTHATMFTGLMPPRHGAVHTSDRLVAQRVRYLPHVLRERGYHTAAYTGGAFVSDSFGFDAGFDRFTITDPITVEDDQLAKLEPEKREARERQNLEAAAKWVDSRGGEPWFLFLHTYTVHEYCAPEGDLARFDTKPVTTPGRVFPQWLTSDAWKKEPGSAGDLDHVRDRYDATIAYCDRMLEQLFLRLEKSGQLKNTVVVIVGDHGEEFMEHGSMRHSVTLYEEMLQVPWILAAPSIPPGTIVNEPVSQADIMPTLLDLLDVPVPGDLDGHSRRSALRGDLKSFIETPLFAQVASPFSRRVALRRGQWKMISSENAEFPGSAVPAAPVEFFDLRNDPLEGSNLIDSNPKAMPGMRDAMHTVESYLRARAVGSTKATIDAALDERLRQLGYAR